MEEFLFSDEGSSLLSSGTVGMVNGKTQYFSISIKSTVSSEAGGPEQWKGYLELEKFVDNFNKEAPKGLKGLR